MSQRFTAKHIALLAIVAALLFLVLNDRSGPGSDGAAAGSPRQAFLDAHAVTRSAEALASDRQRWEQAHETALRAWDNARSRLIQAPSVNVAESSLRALLEDEMGAVDLSLSVSAPMPRRVPVAGEPLHLIGLTLDFDAPNPDAVHALLDRIENAQGARLVITDLEIRGPGRTGRDGLHVKLDVAALAWIGAQDRVASAPSGKGGADG